MSTVTITSEQYLVTRTRKSLKILLHFQHLRRLVVVACDNINLYNWMRLTQKDVLTRADKLKAGGMRNIDEHSDLDGSDDGGENNGADSSDDDGEADVGTNILLAVLALCICMRCRD